jgi:hypothetical protein
MVGSEVVSVVLGPRFQRLDSNLSRISRGDLIDHTFLTKIYNHEILTVDSTGSRVSSSYGLALLEYLIVKNNSSTESVNVRLWMNDHPAAISDITVPPGVPMVLRNVNYGQYVPLISSNSPIATAEVEVFFFAAEDCSPFNFEYIQFMPAELTWTHYSGGPQ